MVEFLDELNRMPIPVAVEYLDVFTPQYFSNRVTG
jgi:3-deoxy-D-arabino-heptulosonate 7-phosphate (DAHP) synthase